MVKEKVCKGCIKTLSVSEFSPSRNIKDGYENKCRKCRAEQRKKYHNNNTCKQCGKKFSATKKQVFCSNYCVHASRRACHVEFEKEVNSVENRTYLLMSEYRGQREKVAIKHKKCGNIFEVTPGNFLGLKSRCPHCYGNIRKTTEEFKEEVESLVGSDYIVLGEYKNNVTKLTMKHSLCGFIYEATPERFLQGRRCPDCRSSHGEEAIKKYLTEKGVTFEREKTFEECRYKRPLPFDFAIYTDGVKDNPRYLIEFDGRHHYESIEFWGGEAELIRVQERDAIKDIFCKEKGINLIRIPYFEIENIPKILDGIL